MGDYYRAVDDTIDRAISGKAQLAITTLPSFWEESGLRLIGNEIYLVSFASSLWGDSHIADASGEITHQDFSLPKVETRVDHAPLDPQTANRVKQIYSRAIASEPQSPTPGLDGISYRFSMPGKKCVEIWSPEFGTPEARLIELLERLSAHAQLSEPDDLHGSEAAILTLLDEIEKP